ncbi:hypothetical protein [Paracoccus sp. KR1-242]|uniref:hypothetical protein n=1 Tax=Paracoccus sp. KR1-242 TaxID=3410028 RepID=UPI003C0BB682
MAIFSFIAGTAWWAGVSASIGTAAAGAIISVGQTLSWSLAAAALLKPTVPRQQVQATINQTDSARIRGWGRMLLGGTRAFFESHSGHLHQVVAVHHGPVDGLMNVWVDGQPVATEATPANADGGGRVNRYTAVLFKDGSGNNGNYDGVFDSDGLGWRDIFDAFPALWTLQHRLEDQATFYAVLGDPADEDFAKYFPKGPQTVVQVELRGSRVRNLAGSQIYSENAGLCIRDFLTHADGWNFPLSKLDGPSWTTFTSICAQEVDLKAGGTEPRYRLCGYYSLEDALKDVTGRMLAVCDGQLYETAEGKIGILGGAWSEPDVTITSADILSVSMQEGFNPLETYNVLKGSFVSPSHGYQPTQVREIKDTAALATASARSEQHDLDMCPSGTQLQRLMKIKMAKDRRAQVGSIRTNLVGMKARWPKGDGVHTIRINAPEFELVGVFEVTSHSFDVPKMYCDIGLASLANPYPWNPATQETDLPLTYSSIPTPNNTVGNPANAALVQERVLVSSGVYGVRVAVSVDNPGRNDLRLRAEIAKGLISDVSDDDAGEWVAMTGRRLRAVSGIVDDGAIYTIRIKWAGRTDWVSAGSINVTANADQPDPPGSFSALATGATVSLDWINAASDYFRTQIWRATTNDIGAASLVKTVAGVAGQVSGYDDTPGLTGTLYYWAVTINGSGVPSNPAGPETVTL